MIASPVAREALSEETPTSELIARYNEGSRLLEESVKGLHDAELRARPVEGKWSTLEAVCHISDAEQFFADRMKRTLAMDRPLLMRAGTEDYARPLQYDRRALTEELALTELTRSQMVRILQHIPPEAWERQAVHSEAGLLTLRQIVIYAINHLEHHVEAIRQKRQVLGV